MKESPGDLPSCPLSRATDPVTSALAAAGHVASGRNAGQRKDVLAAVRAGPGRTSDEIADGMRASRHLPARRLIELERAGLVRRGEARLSRVGGRPGITWFPVEGCP